MNSKLPLLIAVPVLLLCTAVALWYFAFSATPSLVPAASDPAITAGTDRNDAQAPGEAAVPEAVTAGDGSEPPVDGAAVAGGAAKPTADETRKKVPEASGTLAGRVVDARGAPVPGARVIVARTLQWSTIPGAGDARDAGSIRATVQKFKQRAGPKIAGTSGTDGSFAIDAPEGGEADQTLTLQVKARGFQVQRHTHKHPGTGRAELGDLVLEPAAVLAGRVLDSDNRPVAGALVRRTTKAASAFDELQMPGTAAMMESQFDGDFDAMPGAAAGMSASDQMARTDAKGVFEMAHATAGDLMLRVTHPDHPAALLTDRKVDAGQVIDDLVIVFDAAATISGRLTGTPKDQTNLLVMARSEVTDQPGPTIFGLDPRALATDMGLALGERTAEVAVDGAFTLRGLHADRKYKVWAVQTGEGFGQAKPCSDTTIARAGATDLILPFTAAISVTFRVVDQGSGKPVTRMAARPQWAGGGDLFADLIGGAMAAAGLADYPDGRVTLDNLRPKDGQHLKVVIEAPGYATLQHRVDSPLTSRAGVIDLGTLRLRPAPAIRVLVTDAASGKPVAGADVRLDRVEEDRQAAMRRVQAAMESGDLGAMAAGFGGRPASGVTGTDGQCVLNGVPDQRVKVTVASGEYATRSGEPITLPAAGELTQRIALQRGGEVQVTVHDAKGNPAASIVVELMDAANEYSQRHSDDQGVATFAHLPPGLHRFRLQKKRAGGFPSGLGAPELPGRRSAERNRTVELSAKGDWTEVEVRDTETEKLTLTQGGVGSLRGIVRENGRPLRGARVKLIEGSADSGAEDQATQSAALDALSEQLEGMMGGGGKSPGKTDAEGNYTLDNLPVGAHRLRVTHSDRAMPTSIAVQIREGAHEFNIDLTTTLLIGRVVDQDGAPVAGARVSVAAAADAANREVTQAMKMAGQMFDLQLGGKQGPTTDDNGSFELRGASADQPIHVRIDASGFAPAVSAEIKLAKGETRRGIDFKLRAGGSVRVRVAGKAVAMAAVRAIYDGPEQNVDPVIGMMQGGACTLKGLVPGKWKISVTGFARAGKSSTPQIVEVKAGETTRVTMEQ